jgi:hypothetical protein
VWVTNGDIITIYAHSLKGHPESDWEPLDTHAKAVAKLARQFADAFIDCLEISRDTALLQMQRDVDNPNISRTFLASRTG